MVTDLDDAGVVDVPGDDGHEDLLGDLLDKVEFGKQELLQNLINLKYDWKMMKNCPFTQNHFQMFN